MSTGTKVILAVAVVGVIGLLLVAVGVVATGAFFWSAKRSEQQVVQAMQAELEARTAAVKQAAEANAEAEARAAAAKPADPATINERRAGAVAKGAEAILRQQAPDGSWAKGAIGVSALCTDALLEAGMTTQDPRILRAVQYLLKNQKDDGGIYDDVGLKIYSSSISLKALAKADAKAYAAPIKKTLAYIEKCQWGADESIEKSDLRYGGFGYGKNNRPDMSNTQFCLDALKAAGVPKDSEVWTRAAIFVSRSQDRSESNDKAFAGVDDGGGIYSPVETKAETIELPDGRKIFKTYGSMTYAVLKSFVFSNLDAKDPRVQAALDWIRKHWTFEENPEMGQQGLYYYYMTAARALAAYSKASGEEKVMDARRRPHDWRTEITEAILSRQRPDGTWVNTAERWYEGEQMAIVPTSYCLIALAECKSASQNGHGERARRKQIMAQANSTKPR
jgi:squalene-hopene/tetraprenyl-beta-curcumene cyclase